MAALSFTAGDDGKYHATATVNAAYALHVERQEGGFFNLYQSSVTGGKKMRCAVPAAVQAPGTVLDWVFDHGVYPMEVEFVSDTAVTSATLTERAEG